MDLVRLGQELRQRRKELAIPRTRLARRVGVSPTYMWVLEEAKPRANGEPSRPSRYLLMQLAAELAMNMQQTEWILGLADYEPVLDEGRRGSPPLVDHRQTRADDRRAGTEDGRGVLLPLLREVRDLLPHAMALSMPLGSEFRGRIRSHSPHDSLVPVLHEMWEQDFSQVIVRDEGAPCLLTLTGVTYWLVKAREHGTFSLSDAMVGDVVQFEDEDRYRVLSAAATVLDAVCAFTQTPSLQAIILTDPNGDSHSPIGIVTPWDLVEVGGRDCAPERAK